MASTALSANVSARPETGVNGTAGTPDLRSRRPALLCCEAIGRTAMADLSALLSPAAKTAGIGLWAKREFDNPGLSHKDRIAQGILTAAERSGELTRELPDGRRVKKTVVAASSGNTGNAIAWVATQKGYGVVIITNRKCSAEKQADIRSKGATLLIANDLFELSQVACTDGGGGVRTITPAEAAALPEAQRRDLAKCTVTEEVARQLGWHTPDASYPRYVECYMKMEQIMALDPGYFSVRQYDNLENYQAHYDTLAREVHASRDGGRCVTDFVFCGSTGGTITGVGTYLKEQDPSIRVVLADPEGSKLRNYLKGGLGAAAAVPAGFKKTLIEGAGKGQSTGIFEARKKRVRTAADGSVTEEWVLEPEAIVVQDRDAVLAMHRLHIEAGLWVGSSSGLNVHAACAYADSLAAGGARGRKIVTILCDPGHKYESKFFNDTWLERNGLPTYTASLARFA